MTRTEARAVAANHRIRKVQTLRRALEALVNNHPFAPSREDRLLATSILLRLKTAETSHVL